MKKLILGLLLTSISTAFACPNLNGSYSNADGERMELQVKAGQNGVKVLNNGMMDMILDGQAHNLEDGAQYVATCTDNEISIDILVQNEVVENLKYTQTSDGFIFKSSEEEAEYTKD